MTAFDLWLESLRDDLFYDDQTGEFVWNTTRMNVRPGERAGRVRKDGAYQIGYDGKRYYAGRLAYLLMKGKWPEGTIYHVNGDRTDFRWANLKEKL